MDTQIYLNQEQNNPVQELAEPVNTSEELR